MWFVVSVSSVADVYAYATHGVGTIAFKFYIISVYPYRVRYRRERARTRTLFSADSVTDE